MFGLSPLMSFMMFIFWPFILVGAGVWGHLAFKKDGGVEK